MLIKAIIFAFFSVISSVTWADIETAEESSATAVQEQTLAAVAAKTNDVVTASFAEKPLVERYILDELKATRHDLQDLERRLTIEITDRELSVADKSLSYAEQTVNFFFYVIAGVAH